jgi:hypothetical protein
MRQEVPPNDLKRLPSNQRTAASSVNTCSNGLAYTAIDPRWRFMERPSLGAVWERRTSHRCAQLR